jgi:precorrin-2/cobalt-factor-2 C20-methyltransferase
VGPGDPELLTLKAVNILKQVDVVFAAASSKNSYSIALDIAGPHIPQGTEVRRLAFPMTQDRTAKEHCWRQHAETLIAEMDQGRDVAFITLGDSMTYSTYGYVLKYVRRLRPELPVVTVPGITSYQGAAAAINTPLVEGEQSLVLLSGANGGDRLRLFGDAPDNVVLLKAYKNINDICAALKETRLLENSVGVANCTLPDQKVITDKEELCRRKPGYWTLIIAKRDGLHGPSQS